jgi:sugar phosphate isomerase/epimerase
VVPARLKPGRDILWSASLPPATVEQRVAAASAAGFRGVSVSPHDATAGQRDGRSPEELSRWALDLGVELLTLDAIIEWYPHEPPKRSFGPVDQDVAGMLELARRFGVRSVSALAPFPSSAGRDELAECFARLCDQAAERGLGVHIEFTPFPPVPDLAAAWDLVRRADRVNGGVLFDTWHFFRGTPDLDLLASIPGERIMAVQISDGAEGFRESLLKDTFRHRELPGAGSFDLVGVLRILRQTGGLNTVGPEVLSEELFGLDPVEAAVRMQRAMDRIFAAL